MLKKKSFPRVAKNAARWHRYCHAVASSWTIKHFDFQKLAGLWLPGEVVNHVGIYGSKMAEGFSAFQRQPCYTIHLDMISNQKQHFKACHNTVSIGLSLHRHYAMMFRYTYVKMTTKASQITSLTAVYSIVYSGADQRKHQSSASLAFVRGIHRDRWIPRTKGK